MEPLMALFPPGKGGGSGVEYGFKGKGVLIHTLVDISLNVRMRGFNENIDVLPLVGNAYLTVLNVF
jgi:hypothetical protein